MGKGGSQLSQLKSALHSAGLSRSNSSGSKKRKRGGDDGSSRKSKLAIIENGFNAFDTITQKRKFDVGGVKNVKGETGKPGVSRSKGIENRRKTLLPEIEARGRAGGIIDRRFGEGDASLTPEEKALQRFTVERKRRGNFNLEDDDHDLTHGGMSLGDDGFGLGDVGLKEDDRKKSKAEVMQEVMAKSKAYKHERQRAREEDDETRLELDNDLSSLRTLLGAPAPSQSKGPAIHPDRQAAIDKSNTVLDNIPDELQHKLEGKSQVDRELLAKLIGPPSDDEQESESEHSEPSQHEEAQGDDELDNDATDAILATLTRQQPPPKTAESKDDDDYDRYVRELAFERRVVATDRLKTDVEIAEEARSKLLAAEEARLKRMRGEEVASRDSKGKKRAAQADDLDDDFMASDDEAAQFGEGLQVEGQESDVEPEAGDGGEEGGSSEDEGSLDVDAMLADEDSDIEAPEGDTELVPRASKSKSKRKKELAFNFPCPTTHSEFLELLEGTDQADLAVIVQRTRVLYHPSLAEDNKDKLAQFNHVLQDHILYSASKSTNPLDALHAVLPHVLPLSVAYPLTTASYHISKLGILSSNLLRGLASDPLLSSSKTFPGLPELLLLRIIGLTWSTSDLSHPVAAPALLLISQYLNQCRIRSAQDVASGLFLCTLAINQETLSKRYVPEVNSFLASTLAVLLPHSFKNEKDLPGVWSVPDVFRSDITSLRISKKAAKATRTYTLQDLISQNQKEDTRCALIVTALELLQDSAKMWVSLDSFIEAYQPFETLLSDVLKQQIPSHVHVEVEKTRDMLSRMLNLSKKARKPLALQSHKPIPIPTFIPKFHDSYTPGRAFDPDSERNEANKLKALYKKERKGAIRELRKDNRFLASEKAKAQKEKDDAYKSKLNRIMSGLQEERHEEKVEKRQKDRAKAQAKRRG